MTVNEVKRLKKIDFKFKIRALQFSTERPELLEWLKREGRTPTE